MHRSTQSAIPAMSGATSLFATPATEITLERIRELVNQTPNETLTVEYKQEFSRSLVKTVAAMANSYGGLIIVGITEEPAESRVVGVPGATATQIVDACHDSLEPPWQPEIVQVPIPGTDTYILVVRVDAAGAPRPLLMQGTAPVRLHGRNATADRHRLAQLFTEAAPAFQAVGRALSPPNLPESQKVSGSEQPVPVDFIVRSGLLLPLDEAATWKPLSEKGVDLLAETLNKSPIVSALGYWCNKFGIQGVNTFDRRGFNRARHARLAWQGVTDNPEVPHPIEAIVDVHLPDRYGVPSSHMTVTVDLIVRARLFFLAARGFPPTMWQLTIHDLYTSLDGVLTALTDKDVVLILASLAGVDPVLVGQPPNLDFVTGPLVADLLDHSGLRPVKDAGPSGGANLIADPSLDLSNASARKEQLDSWLQQIALDTGLRGMESALLAYHRQREA